MLELDSFATQKIDNPDAEIAYEKKDYAVFTDGHNAVKISHIERKQLTNKVTGDTYTAQFIRLQSANGLPSFISIPLTGISKNGKTYTKTSNLAILAKIFKCKGEDFAGIPEEGERLPSKLDKPFAIALKAVESNGRTYFNIDWDYGVETIMPPEYAVAAEEAPVDIIKNNIETEESMPW